MSINFEENVGKKKYQEQYPVELRAHSEIKSKDVLALFKFKKLEVNTYIQ